MVTIMDKQTDKRRAQVRKAVAKWRTAHREEYNAYSRSYLARPEPRKRHIARCKRYRARVRSEKLAAQSVARNSFCPTPEVNQQAPVA